MKKFGFTLAEVLITLGIIGVVSAITLPTLTSNTRTAQVGPKLAKAASMFEQANQAMLNDNNLDSLRALNVGEFNNIPFDSNAWPSAYVLTLRNFMKISVPTVVGVNFQPDFTRPAPACGLANMNDNSIEYFTTRDGILYGIRTIAEQAGAARQPHRNRIGELYIDVNGPSAAPNTAGRDIFAFAWYADGSLRPVGSDWWDEVNPGGGACHWQNECNDVFNQLNQDGYACTGHVFANDLKVLYR